MDNTNKDTRSQIALVACIALLIAFVVALNQRALAQPCAMPDSMVIGGEFWSWHPTPPAEVSAKHATKTVTSGDRILYFVHGMGGDATSWNLVASRTSYLGAPGYNARQTVYASPVTYLHNGNLVDAALELDHYFSTVGGPLSATHQITNLSKNFIIAHSLGGLVARQLDQMYEESPAVFSRQFGGLVTFGSPHQGAIGLLNIDPNGKDMARKFVTEACKILSDPELIMYPSLPILRWIPGLDPWLKTTVQSTCGTFGSVFTPFAARDFYQPITAEIHPQSNALNDLNSAGVHVPSVAFYGVEQEPIFWRTATSFFHLDSVGLGLLTDPFSATNDNALVDFASQERAKYAGLEHTARQGVAYHEMMAFAWRFVPFAAPYHKKKAKQKLKSALAFHGANSWYADANDLYKEIIGAQVNRTKQDGWFCLCFGRNGFWTNVDRGVVDGPEDCEPASPKEKCITFPRYVWTRQNYESDGLVLATSAHQLPGALAALRMPQTNHQQMRNCLQTKEKLKMLFDGHILNGLYFATPVR